jgi:hypothetical protein
MHRKITERKNNKNRRRLQAPVLEQMGRRGSKDGLITAADAG